MTTCSPLSPTKPRASQGMKDQKCHVRGRRAWGQPGGWGPAGHGRSPEPPPTAASFVSRPRGRAAAAAPRPVRRALGGTAEGAQRPPSLQPAAAVRPTAASHTDPRLFSAARAGRGGCPAGASGARGTGLPSPAKGRLS
ncbi:unnamed protein product [Rangifer tarandus platyrhynchus]|uniref:Uncharacterized protein n=2 Tax=Rangifer tarandus platyrhynchus TaxID=3082113 RepID=A0ABN8Z2P9_RANTA|nr:unnamed protein product [Rangifer tarandus platyrhynchus]CAI9705316.1 unnamed protein product [Rangifer tarandus platyrhynchus]